MFHLASTSFAGDVRRRWRKTSGYFRRSGRRVAAYLFVQA
jgi:hypothetical protein